MVYRAPAHSLDGAMTTPKSVTPDSQSTCELVPHDMAIPGLRTRILLSFLGMISASTVYPDLAGSHTKASLGPDTKNC